MSLVFLVSIIALIAAIAVIAFRRPAGGHEPNIGILSSPNKIERQDMEFGEPIYDEALLRPRSAPLPDNVTSLSEYQLKREAKGGLPAVTLTPERLVKGREATVRYRGKLKDSRDVILHYGYGFDQWYDVREIPMSKERGFWKASLKVEGCSKLNLCFKDGNGAWDNNEGDNWSFNVKL